MTTQLTNYDGTVLQASGQRPGHRQNSAYCSARPTSRHDGFQENIYNGKDYDQDDTRYGTFSLEHQTTDRWNTEPQDAGRRPELPAEQQWLYPGAIFSGS